MGISIVVWIIWLELNLRYKNGESRPVSTIKDRLIKDVDMMFQSTKFKAMHHKMVEAKQSTSGLLIRIKSSTDSAAKYNSN